MTADALHQSAGLLFLILSGFTLLTTALILTMMRKKRADARAVLWSQTARAIAHRLANQAAVAEAVWRHTRSEDKPGGDPFLNAERASKLNAAGDARTSIEHAAEIARSL